METLVPVGESAAARPSISSRLLDAAVTILSLGTNKLMHRGTGWLKRNGLAAWIVPALLVNEGFGAYRVLMLLDANGWW